jgi:hypothetical protein
MDEMAVRDAWASFRAEVDRAHRDAKDSQGALEALADKYRLLDDDARPVIDRLLIDWLLSDDETVRFDSVALIRQFQIQAAVPALEDLAARLASDPGPGAPFEIAKISRLIAALERGQLGGS